MPDWKATDADGMDPAVNDYLQESSRIGRRSGLVLTSAAALVSWAIFLLPVVEILRREPSTMTAPTIVVILTLFGLLGLYCTCLAWRLAMNRRAANKVTVMPPWTIQTFGALLLVGLTVVVLRRDDYMLAIEGVPLALAMILVSRNLANRERRRIARETASGNVARLPPA